MTPAGGVNRPRTGFRFLDEPVARGGILAFAHRGGAGHPELAGLENTMHAFQHAVALGYRYLETDVHATSDGQLLAFHDPVLERMTGSPERIEDRTYDELRSMLVGGREVIPRLVDLFEAFPAARFNVDLKTSGTVDPMVDLLVRTGAHDRVCVGAFDERVLRRFRRRLADRGSHPVATCCGVVSAATLLLRGPGRRLQPLLRDSGAAFQVPVRRGRLRVVDRHFVRNAHALGRHVHVWTVDARAEMEHLLDLGVDGLITDRTDLLRDVLVERGLWDASTGPWEDADELDA
jgi:glycerophosphoryl diester phosphodiesterase